MTGGRSDPECTHVILTLDEYNDLKKKVRDSRNERDKAKEDAERMIAAVKADENKKIQQIQEDSELELEKLRAAVSLERSAKEYQVELNQNLLRISRERANADRKIRPKKERSGYIVLSSRQKKYRYKENRSKMEEVFLWETVLQTPYPVAFTAEQTMTETKELFTKDSEGVWLIGRIGIDAEYNGKYEELVKDSLWNDWQKRNIILEKIYNVNVKAGYWEIILTHTKPLDDIGSELL